ncbi:hypothetical protein [Gemmatimonas sp.]|uniref:hypothetical protein n=1 Tax=Gemmatimonas sp. TaxID=1962908 RepID=UPI003566F03F
MVPLAIVLSVMLVFLAVTCVQIALIEPVARRLALPPSLDFITAVASLALVGFALFWLYLLDPRAGTVALAAFWMVVLTLAAQRVHGSARLPLSADFVQPLVLTLSSACLGLGMLLLFRTPDAAAQIAAHRFTVQQLPADNIIPQIFAERLLNDQSPKALIGDWLSSDRPPLATGWILLFQQPLQLVGVSRANAFFVGSFTFQMTWVAGVWAVLRACRFGRSASTIAIVFTAFTSVALINSVFTWPKLSAGAFTLAAWAVLLGSRRIGRAGAVLCAVFLTLALLSHGAAALAVVATVFVLAVEWLRRRDRDQMWIAAWGVGAGTALYAPWFAYQRWYEPPGDRLVKWHLAGVIPIDGRSSTHTLVDVYRQLSVSEWLDLRWSNTNVLFREMFNVDRFIAPSVDVRTNEFFFLFAGIGLAGFCYLALPILSVAVARSDSALRVWVDCRRFAWLTLATLGFTILLLFGPSGTIIHQIPYVIPLSLAALPIAFISSVAHRVGALLLALQCVWFLVTWIPASPGSGGPLSYGGVFLLVAGWCLSGAAVAFTWNDKSRSESSSSGAIGKQDAVV